VSRLAAPTDGNPAEGRIMRQSSDIPALRGRWQSEADAPAAVSDPDFPALPDIPDAIRSHWAAA
jgi:hypothetical protein